MLIFYCIYQVLLLAALGGALAPESQEYEVNKQTKPVILPCAPLSKNFV